MRTRIGPTGPETWFSVCPKAHEYQEDCQACNAGYWSNDKEREEDGKLFQDNYTEWYRKHNNGLEPDKETIEYITGIFKNNPGQ